MLGQNKQHDEMSSSIQGLSVVTKYTKNHYLYVLDRIDFEQSPLSTFKLKDGTEISYQQYYKEKYSVEIKVL